MLSLGPIGFLSPLLLASAVLLPLLWYLLRALPPRPRQVLFPGAALLIGLTDPVPRMARMPLWLMLLRMGALGALIVGLAGPVWRPDPTGGLVARDADAVLVIMDAGWAAGPDWDSRQRQGAEVIASAGSRPIALLAGDGQQAGPLVFGPPADALAKLRAMRPQAWPSALPSDPDAVLALAPQGRLASIWISDGLDHPHRLDWAQALATRGDLSVIAPGGAVPTLRVASGEGGGLHLVMPGDEPLAALPQVLAIGPDPGGVERVLARLDAVAQPLTTATATQIYPVPMDLPPELRNRVTRFVIDGVASAGAVVLADARIRRPKIALTGNLTLDEGQQLLDPGHYLRRAAAPFADLVEGSLGDILQTAPDVVVLVDTVLPSDERRLSDWVRAGGVLIRFAGPRMAASPDLGLDPLLPVRLRPGGRETGGALGWGAPRDLAPWPDDSPLSDLPRPPVAVRAQLVAEPGPQTEAHIIARLEDATPLITRAPLGDGQMILFHVAAEPSWSDLPLSLLFVAIIERLAETARPQVSDPEDAEVNGGLWQAQTVLDGWGNPSPAPRTMIPVSGAVLDAGPVPGLPAGLYAADGRLRALDAGSADQIAAVWDDARLIDAGRLPMKRLAGWFLVLAGLGLAGDAVASAMLGGNGRRVWRRVKP